MDLGKPLVQISRPPVVTILGHVDHGKTTLLDFIRKTEVAKREAGGITQRIGASLIKTKEGKKITFIDTPGHAAFYKMRSRGAYVADMAVLVVAGEEGVKPQTKEALNFILEVGVPYIVAVTKIDLPTANVDLVRGEMEKIGVSFEGRGGNVPLIGVSGRTGEGVEKLLDLIVLTAEVYGLKGSENDPLEAVVIETGKDKRGLTVSVVVKSGKIRVGQTLVTETNRAKVRGIFDSFGKSIKEVLPGEPALLLGFEEIPEVGSKIWSVEDKGESYVVKREEKTKVLNKGKISLILKASTLGSIEAITSNLPPDIGLIYSDVGDITESDIFLAKSTDSLIFGFEVKISQQVLKLAETENVRVEIFDIIYKLFEKLEEILKKENYQVKGKAEIIAIFPFDKAKVAGCRVLSGEIKISDKLILLRNDSEIGEVRIVSMKKQKSDIQSVKQGEECGILLSPQLDFRISDVLISLQK